MRVWELQALRRASSMAARRAFGEVASVGEQFTLNRRPPKTARARLFGTRWVGERQGGFISERAVAGGFSVWGSTS
ncbi:MAG: hypothetical protein A2Z04_01480 [Chloroflexi bacterium RBG_16_57_9]|nr:MAG: hypothetical protein A2Z04_01480 [Chloroflexi bacterium RBG_16_57_9]